MLNRIINMIIVFEYTNKYFLLRNIMISKKGFSTVILAIQLLHRNQNFIQVRKHNKVTAMIVGKEKIIDFNNFNR